MTAPAARLDEALAARRALGLGERESATAYRLVNGEADGFGDWTVDVYDRWLVAQSYAEDPATEAPFLDALAALPFEGVYLKRRPRQASNVQHREREDRNPSEVVRGRSAPEALTIHESGMPFEVQLGDGFSTGLFLDQRAHRRRLLQTASGKRVLNLFAYTCGFGAAAAAGGAAKTDNIDVAKRALEWGKRNYALAGLDLSGHRFFARDVFDVLARAARRGERHDIVVLDPPSYARRSKGSFSASRDYVGLCASALRVTERGGALLACCNMHSLSVAEFEGWLTRAAAEAGTEIAGIERIGLPGDFPTEAGAPPHLKAAWITPG